MGPAHGAFRDRGGVATQAVLDLHLHPDEDVDGGGGFFELVLAHRVGVGRKADRLYLLLTRTAQVPSSTIAIPWPTPTHMAASP